MAEVDASRLALNLPAARLIARSGERPLLLDEVETMLGSDALVIDACRYVVRQGHTIIPLATRAVLFALVRALGEAWTGDVARQELIARAFGSRFVDESHRARLRVEVGRLRAMLREVAAVRATKNGFALVPQARDVVVLARPIEEEHAPVLAVLADGESWSSSALALALGMSQRSMQRALDSLASAGKVQAFGRGRARRWATTPVPGFTTVLLLPAPLLID
jgi:DNA-binding winged helix-turn-helix (wHTH) protein